MVDSGQPPDGRAANINSSPQFREGSSLKHPHLLLSCNIVKHVEHFLSQSCFHRHRDSGSIVSSGFCGEHDPVWPYRELTQAHSLKIEIESFSPLRRGECFNQPVIAHTKQDSSSMGHFPEAMNVTSSSETRTNWRESLPQNNIQNSLYIVEDVEQLPRAKQCGGFLRAARGVYKNKHIQPRMLNSRFNR